MKKIIICFIILFVYNSVFAQTHHSDDELKRILIKGIAKILVDEVPDEYRKFPLSISLQNKSSDGEYLRVKLYQGFLDRGFRIYEEADSTQFFSVNIEDSDLTYKKIWRENWVGGKKVRREVFIRCTYVIKGIGGEVNRAGEVQDRITDEIPLKFLEEQGGNPKSQLKRDEKSFWEPIGVSLIVGALIYAFYAGDTN